jgi:hypothetical protein
MATSLPISPTIPIFTCIKSDFLSKVTAYSSNSNVLALSIKIKTQPSINMLFMLDAITAALFSASAGGRILPRDAQPPVDPGQEYGAVHVINSCKYDLFGMSAGAWPVGFDQSGVEFKIPAGTTHEEPFREVATDPTLHKLQGQGISIKLTQSPKDYANNVLQLEYALIQNPNRPGTIKRISYDVSLLDCAKPHGDHINVTDAQSSVQLDWNQKKIDGCPGYQGGLALYFDNSKICRPIYCDGVGYCDSIYDYDRTRQYETSFECGGEYKGPLWFETCAANGDG